MSREKSFQIYEKKHASGNLGYRVDMGRLGRKRVFKSFRDRRSAEAFRKKCLAAEAKKQPVELRDLDELVRHEVLAALSRLNEFNASITEAVDFFIRHARPAKSNATISELMQQFKGVKQKAGRSEKYLDTAWKSFFTPFRDHFKDCQVANVTADACEKYIFKSKKWNATTRRSHLRHLTVLFNFAVDRKYAGINPFKAVEKPKKPASTSRSKVVTVENVIKMLHFAYENDFKRECAALVLSLFCGVRVDEVARLNWENVKLDAEKPVIVLDDEQTKTNSGRINAIPANALEWLKLLRSQGEIVGKNYESRMRSLRRRASAGFKQNSARICFASYHLVRWGNAPRTAFAMGHDNPTLLYRTYKAMVTPEESQRYWKITPDYDGKDAPFDSTPTDEEVSQARFAKIARGLAADFESKQAGQ